LLKAGWSGDRILVDARFSTPVQTSPGAHPASNTMGTNSFHGGRAARTDVDYPSPTSTKVKETVDLHLYSPSGPSSSILGPTLPLPFYPPVIILPKPQYTPNATGLNKEPTDLPHSYSIKEQRHNSIKI